MRDKKGISPVISWILLLGFTISLGVLVTNWYLGRAEKMTETTLNTLEGGIECNEVNINIAYTKDTHVPPNCVIKVANTGKLKVDSVKINEKQFKYDRNPKEYKNYTSADIPNLCSLDKITAIPLIKIGNNLMTCPNDRTYDQKII